jgi:hypothetical protein
MHARYPRFPQSRAALIDLAALPLFLGCVVLLIALSGEITTETHRDGTGTTSASPAVTMTCVKATAAERPAVSANGTVTDRLRAGEMLLDVRGAGMTKLNPQTIRRPYPSG